MSTEKYSNAALTSLNGAINSSATSLVVVNASNFPTAGQFRILLNSEIMLVTGVAGTTFTVTRGAEGTTANSHGDGTAVYEVLTAGAVDTIRQDISPSDLWANRPASEKAGKIWLPTDGFMLSRDGGSAWKSWGPLFPFTETNDAPFSWVNQGGATVTTSQGGVFLLAPASNTHNMRLRVQSAPSTPYTITAAVRGIWDAFTISGLTTHSGLVWRDSASGKMETFGFLSDFSTYGQFFTLIGAAKWDNPTSLNSYYRSVFTALLPSPTEFLRITDDGTTRTCYVSTDGVNFQQVHTVSRTDFLTPNQIGYFADSNNGSSVGLNILSWKQS